MKQDLQSKLENKEKLEREKEEARKKREEEIRKLRQEERKAREEREKEMKKQQVVNPYLLMQMEERNRKEEEEARIEEEREKEQKAKESTDGVDAGVTSKGVEIERQLIQLIDDELLNKLNEFAKENRLSTEENEK